MQKELLWKFRVQEINQEMLGWAISKKEFDQRFLSICLRIYNLFMETVETRNRATFFEFLATNFPSINEQHRSLLRDSVAIYFILNKRNLPYPDKANVARKFLPFKKKMKKCDQLALPEYKEEEVVNCWLEALALANKEKRIVTGVFISQVISNYLSRCEEKEDKKERKERKVRKKDSFKIII